MQNVANNSVATLHSVKGGFDMINFVRVVSNTFKKCCREQYTIKSKDSYTVQVSFKNFGIVLHYFGDEYNVSLWYYRNKPFYKRKTIFFKSVLQSVVRDKDKIPEYKFISASEEDRMSFLVNCISLINEYFNELSNLDLKTVRVLHRESTHPIEEKVSKKY